MDVVDHPASTCVFVVPAERRSSRDAHFTGLIDYNLHMHPMDSFLEAVPLQMWIFKRWQFPNSQPPEILPVAMVVLHEIISLSGNCYQLSVHSSDHGFQADSNGRSWKP